MLQNIGRNFQKKYERKLHIVNYAREQKTFKYIIYGIGFLKRNVMMFGYYAKTVI